MDKEEGVGAPRPHPNPSPKEKELEFGSKINQKEFIVKISVH